MLGKDSDFFVLPVPYYLVLDTLKLHANPPLVTAYARADVLRLLQLDERHLPLFASLCLSVPLPLCLLQALRLSLPLLP